MNSILEDYRKKHPEFGALDEGTLVQQLYDAEYKDRVPFKDFVAKLEERGGELFMNQQAPNPLQRVGRGFVDLKDGIAQLYLHATDPEAAKKYDEDMKSDLAIYNRELDQDSFDWWRLGGNAMALAPLVFVPGGQTVVAQGFSGAAAGAVGAGLLATEGDDFWTDKAFQAGTGALLGGLAPGAIHVTRNTLSNLGAAGKTAWARLQHGGQEQLMHTINDALGRAGMIWDDLGEGVQGQLLEDTLKSLRDAGELSAEAIARKARLLKAGHKPTTGQVTRDPKQWQFERNTAKIDDVGDPLRSRFTEQNQKMLTDSEILAQRFGPAADDYSTAKMVQGTADDYAKASQKQVSKAYDNIPDSNLDWEGLHWSLRTVRDEWSDQLPAPVLNRMDGLIKGTTPPTAKNVLQALKLVNGRKPLEKDAQMAMGKVRSALHTALDEAALQGSTNSKQILDATRVASQRFGFLKGFGKQQTKMVTDLIDNKGNLDNFVSSKVMRGQTDDLYHLKRYLLKMPEAFNLNPSTGKLAWDGIRGQVLRNVNKRAGFGEDATKHQFNGKAWRKAWDALGARRDALYSSQERDLIEQAITVAEDLTTEPPMSAVNYSNTGAALVNVVRQISHYPVIGDALNFILAGSKMGREFIEDAARKARTASSTQGRMALPEQRMYANQALTPVAAGVARELNN